MEKGKARRLMPRLGERRWEVPTIDQTSGYYSWTKTPQRCVVVDVRPEHLWYTVQFENGFKESYKIPRLRDVDLQGGGDR